MNYEFHPEAERELYEGLASMKQVFAGSVTASLMNTTYVDQPAGTSKAGTQNLMTLNAGLSFFIPFRSTGREAE